MDINQNWGCHSHFKWIKTLYISHMNGYISHYDDDALKEHCKLCAINIFYLYMADTTIFVDESVMHNTIIYMKYFTDIHRFHKHCWRATCIVHLCPKLDEKSKFMTRQLAGNTVPSGNVCSTYYFYTTLNSYYLTFSSMLSFNGKFSLDAIKSSLGTITFLLLWGIPLLVI